jgi:hypothetical protein
MVLDTGPGPADHHCMFIRATSTLMALLIVAALAATAFATDSPPPTALAPAPSDTAIQGVLNKCTDATRPHSAITAKAAKTASHTRMLRGTARDTGCGVALVTISVAKKHGKQCRFLKTNGRLGKKSTCLHQRWLTAAGTKTWRVPLDRLRRGTYRVRIRAVDFAGNIEHSHGRRLKLR